MPKVTINDRTVEVEPGTNVIEAGLKVGVQIPHYCYHPRLSVVGQCRMCLVEISDGGRKMPKLQTGLLDPRHQGRLGGAHRHAGGAGGAEGDDGVLPHQPSPGLPHLRSGRRVRAAGLLLQARGTPSRASEYEDKRTYPGRERIPLGANVILNMNRCIQCTRCVRFTEEIAGTGELGFFNRGARVEIGTFPGKELSNPLATCVVDICPVGALTSTRFRFAERVWYLDKKPSLCTGCDVGCNITMEQRRGDIKRYKPRFNVEVNDYWMCDYGRATFERYKKVPRVTAPRVRGVPSGWKEALEAVAKGLDGHGQERHGREHGQVAFFGSGFLTCEEAYLFAKLADVVGAASGGVPVDVGPERTIPNLKGGITGREAAPNRRGAELAGLAGAGSRMAEELLQGDGAERCEALIVCDSDFGRGCPHS